MDTLVLTAAFEPVRRVSWQRAMSLWMGGRVEVVEAYDDRCVRTVRSRFDMPAVVRFVRGVRRRGKARVNFSKNNVYIRDGGRCQFCLRDVVRNDATFDHVHPKSRGGAKTWDNVVLACFACNQKKRNRTPDEAGMKLATKPRRPTSLASAWGLGLPWSDGMPAKWRTYLPEA